MSGIASNQGTSTNEDDERFQSNILGGVENEVAINEDVVQDRCVNIEDQVPRRKDCDVIASLRKTVD